ncbi:nitrate reductase cytochrome c-type subunit [Shimia sp.]|uniref:nitrate reductase cytochrome c-type subunit n=1 Tax=Shimia sp. TaxID=1954381 RepID=UPI003B8B75F2
MKQRHLINAFVAVVIACAGGIAAADQAGTVRALRNEPIDSLNRIGEVPHQETRRFVRNYRQQPPIIPHSIDQYQIDLSANQCLACHDWSVAGDRGAPTLSMTHYLDRDGTQLDAIAGTRWFCNQCHVPQVDAPALVKNTFEPSK